jgi:hypothetical protein
MNLGQVSISRFCFEPILVRLIFASVYKRDTKGKNVPNIFKQISKIDVGKFLNYPFWVYNARKK